MILLKFFETSVYFIKNNIFHIIEAYFVGVRSSYVLPKHPEFTPALLFIETSDD